MTANRTAPPPRSTVCNRLSGGDVPSSGEGASERLQQRGIGAGQLERSRRAVRHQQTAGQKVELEVPDATAAECDPAAGGRGARREVISGDRLMPPRIR